MSTRTGVEEEEEGVLKNWNTNYSSSSACPGEAGPEQGLMGRWKRPWCEWRVGGGRWKSELFLNVHQSC